MRFVQNIFMAVFIIIVFSNLGEKDLKGIQSRNGVLFFIIFSMGI